MQLTIASEEHFEKLWPIFEFCLRQLQSLTDKKETKAEYNAVLKNGFIAFVEEDDKIVGFILGVISKSFLDSSFQARDKYWFVLPEYRKKGVGKILLTAFESLAKARGCLSVIITPTKFGSNEPEKLSQFLIASGYGLFGYQMRKKI